MGNILSQGVKVQGYDIIRRDRLINGRLCHGGGVCFYIRSNIVDQTILSAKTWTISSWELH